MKRREKIRKKNFKSQTGLFILLESLVRGKFKQKKITYKKTPIKIFSLF